MSRSAHQRQQQKLQLQQQLLAQQQVAENESAAAAAELFDLLCVATTMRQILGLHRNMCELVGLRPSPLNEFYPKLKVKIRSWKAQALWKKFDARASQRVYAKGNACTGTRVLVIGAGPCGLRTAIEAQLLGAKVVVVEKRDRVSRNNVLHLWPFVITDLRSLGAKKFYGKFCAGSIDHISIRQIQCILLKVALLLGVEVHEGVSFEQTIEPNGDGCGWRAAVLPSDHAVSHYEFDVLIGADGKRNTLEGFKRKEFRGKLAIAITANFINKKTEAEAKVEEISGVAFIFNQSFFKELYHTTGIDLENIVYYKDETHYFVMTAKKHSLIDKGVIIQDFADPAELLASGNVNTEKLLDYAREAAEFSTKYQMPNLEFAVNHYGKPDVAMFDFTSMFAAESSCRVIVRKNYRLLQCLVGDSLLEPFWPTGSGCARGFLSSMDAAYTIKLWSNPCNSVLGVVAQRESIYRLLNQTTPENLQRDIGSYTVDPATRYPNLNRTSVNVWQIKHLVDADDKSILEQTYMDTNALQITQVDTPIRRKRRSGDMVPLSSVLLRWICSQLHAYDFTKELKEVSDVFTNGKVLCALINRYRPDLVDFNAIQNQKPAECNDLAFKIFEKEMHIQGIMSGKESLQLNAIDSKLWLNYLEQICEVFRGEIPHVKHPKIDFSELREKYRLNNAHAQPDFSKLLQLSSKQKAKSPLQDKVNIPQGVSRRTTIMDDEKLKRQRRHEQLIDNHQYHGQGQNTDMPRKGKKRRNVDKAANIDRERNDIGSVLPRSNADGQFSNRIKSMEQRITARCGTDKKPKDLMRAIGRIDSNDWQIREIEKKMEQCKKTEVHGPKGREKVPKWSKEQFQARQNKMARPNRQDSSEEKYKEIDKTLKSLDKQLKEGHIMDVGERGRNKVASIAGQFVKRDDTSEENKTPPTAKSPKSSAKMALAFKKQTVSEKCHFCKQTVYLMEKLHTEDLVMHRGCLKCHHCHTNLRLGGYAFDRDDPNGRFYCTQHFRLPAKAIRPMVRKIGQKKASNLNQSKQKEQSPSNKVVDSDNAVVSVCDDSKRHLMDKVTQMEMLDRGQTPERIEFENIDAMSDGEPSEEHIIDEHEWSGRNFLPESNNDAESDLSTTDVSDSDSDSDIYEEANDSPLGAQTLQLATDWIGKQKYTESDDSDEFYDSSEGIADDGKDDTEGEEFQKARELRREEVRLQPLPNLPTDTETERNLSVANNQTKEDSNTVNRNIQLEVKIIDSEKSDDHTSERSFKSTTSSINNGTSIETKESITRRKDMEKLEEHADRKLSSEIEAISEKLYHLNNIMKMNKDLESVAKENLLQSDMLKKLTLKEKWLTSNNNDSRSNNSSINFKNKIDQFLNKKQKINNDSSSLCKTEIEKNPENMRENILRSKENVVQRKAKDDNKKKIDSHMGNQLKNEIADEQSKLSHDTNKVEIENILNVVENINISKNEKILDPLDNTTEFSNDNTLKENWVNRFNDRMETIKSQIVEPTISAQLSTNVDIAKYFPSDKSEKTNSPNINKNQKTLKDVDLTKYFPSSPLPQRRSTVVTVADKLKKAKGEQNFCTSKTTQSKINGTSGDNKEDSLKDHQLDGSADIFKKKSPVKIVTSTVAGAKKGNLKIIKKIANQSSPGSIKIIKTSKKSITPQDNSDQLFDEILNDCSGSETRLSSSEYIKISKEEKSPSKGISDKIDCVLKSEGIDIGTVKNHKKILKTKSLDEKEFSSRLSQLTLAKVKEDGDTLLSGVQNIFKRFESMNSLKNSQDFSSSILQSSKNTLQISEKSLISNESSITQSDLEKAMKYLKSEWQNEASNFLLTKRFSYFQEKFKNNYEEKHEYEPPHRNLELLLENYSELKENYSKEKKSVQNSNISNKNEEATAIYKEPITYSSLEELPLVSLSKKEKFKPRQQDTKKKNVNIFTQDLENRAKKVNNNNDAEKEPAVIVLPSTTNHLNSNKNDEIFLKSKNNIGNENKRPLVEDIKNLAKASFDKTVSTSRHGSQVSTQPRTSLEEVATKKENDKTPYSTDSVKSVTHDLEVDPSKVIEEYDPHNQSPTSTLTHRASSSEEDSIEKLFNQFSDEMLVNVEFDSNDELITSTPRAALLDIQDNVNDVTSESKGVYEQHFKRLQFNNDSEYTEGLPFGTSHFKGKGTSPSNNDAETTFSQQSKNVSSKLSANSVLPSTQDLVKETLSKDFSKDNEIIEEYKRSSTFSKITSEDELREEPKTQHIFDTIHKKMKEEKVSSIVPQQNGSGNVLKFTKHLTSIPIGDESSLEWNMENLPRSPLPKRNSLILKMHSVESAAVQNYYVKNDDISKENISQRNEQYLKGNFGTYENISENPLETINNLDTNYDATTHRLIEEFERESRHNLMQRDKHFLDMEKPDIHKESRVLSSLNVSEGLPFVQSFVPNSGKQSSSQSLSTMQPNIERSNGGIPLCVGNDLSSQQTSRSNYFALIGTIDAKPIVVSKLKKLELPNIKNYEEPCNLNVILKNTKYGPGPKPQDNFSEDEDEDINNQIKSTKNIEIEEYATVIKGSTNVGETKRQWPDNKNMFKLETPKITKSTKMSSISMLDISSTSNYSNVKDTLHYQGRSSADSDHSNKRYRHVESQYTQGKHKSNFSNILDAHTRFLLDRSKRLHDQKCDFINERAAERNPYLRDAINEEKKYSAAKTDNDVDNDNIITKYKIKKYPNTPRFPTSHYLGRPYKIQRYDYMPAHSTRQLPIISSLPSPLLSTTSLDRNYHYPSRSGISRLRYDTKSPSRYRELKDSCVLN